jgi:TolB-like protein
VADFADALAAALADGPRVAATPASDPITNERARRRVGPVAGVAGVLLLVVAGALWWRRIPAPPADAPLRLVVLPFENEGAPADSSFAVGVSDAVRSGLVRSSSLEVLARQTSLSLAQQIRQPERAADEVGARYVVTGTVQWSRDQQRVRVRPSLVEIRHGRAIVRWERPITAALTDVFAVQDSIALLVAEATNTSLAANRSAAGGATNASLTAKRRGAANPDAYEAFLNGRMISQDLSVIDVPSMRSAEAAYTRAVTLDSTYGLAWSHLAAMRCFMLSRIPSPERVAAAHAALLAAQRLANDEPTTPLAESVCARFPTHDDARSLLYAKAGIQRFPADPLLRAQAAMLELGFGRMDSAVAEINYAERLDPRNAGVLWRKAHIELWRRNAAAADSVTALGLALTPMNTQMLLWRVEGALVRGDLARAREVVRRHLANSAMRPADAAVNQAVTHRLAWALPTELQDTLLALPVTAFGSPGAYHLVRADLLWTRGQRQAAVAEARLGLAAYPDPQERLALSAIAGQPGNTLRPFVDTITNAFITRGEFQFSPPTFESMARSLAVSGDRAGAQRLVDLILSRPGPYTAAWFAVDPHYALLRR